MSLLPSIFGDYHDPWAARRHQRLRHHPEHYGMGLLPDEIKFLFSMPVLAAETTREKRESFGQPKSTIGEDGFQICMNVEHFLPNEVTVKTVDNHIVVEANHKERPDEHGFISRNFVRKYILPEGYNINEVVSTLSSDGILTIKAPPPAKNTNERIVQIQHTGPAHLTIKENPKKE